MKIGSRPALYRRTVDILFDAYFNDTLRHTDCWACAVGNLVFANMGYTLASCGSWRDKQGEICSPEWYDAVTCDGKPIVRNLNGLTKIQIASTGYTLRETCRIERSFERCDNGKSPEDWMFNGLVAVLEVLKEIHEVTEDEESPQRFKAHYESVLASINLTL